MKTSDGSFHQCYNAQAVVDAEHHLFPFGSGNPAVASFDADKAGEAGYGFVAMNQLALEHLVGVR